MTRLNLVLLVAVLVSALDEIAYPVVALARLYRERADAENVYDELKNQWGWCGYTGPIRKSVFRVVWLCRCWVGFFNFSEWRMKGIAIRTGWRTGWPLTSMS